MKGLLYSGRSRDLSAAIVVSVGLLGSGALAPIHAQTPVCPLPDLEAGDVVQVADGLAWTSAGPQGALAGLPAVVARVLITDPGRCPAYKLDLDREILTWPGETLALLNSARRAEFEPLRTLVQSSRYAEVVLLAYAPALNADPESPRFGYHAAAYELLGEREDSSFAGLRALARHAALAAKKTGSGEAELWFRRWVARAESDGATKVELHFGLFGLGMVLLDAGNPVGARAAFARAVETVEGALGEFHSDMPVASRVQLARAATELEAYDDAVESYQSALRHLGDRERTGGITRGQIGLELALALRDTGDVDAAIRALERSIAAFEANDLRGSGGWSAAVLSLARLHLRAGRLSQADDFYAQAALGLGPGSPGWTDRILLIATDYGNAGHTDRAKQILTRVMALLDQQEAPPRDEVFALRLALARLRLGAAEDLEDAIEGCRAVATAEPPAPPRQRAEALLCTGEAHVLLGRLPEAEEAFLDARALVETHGFSDLAISANHGLSLAYQNAGRSVTSTEVMLQELEDRAHEFDDLVGCGENLRMAPQFAGRPIAGFQYLLQTAAQELDSGNALVANALLIVTQQFWIECLGRAPEASLPLLKLSALFEHKSGDSEEAERILYSALATAIEHLPAQGGVVSGTALDLSEFAEAVGNDAASERFAYLAVAWSLTGQDRLQLSRSLDALAAHLDGEQSILGVFFAKTSIDLQASAAGTDFVGRALRARSRESVRLLIEALLEAGRPAEALAASRWLSAAMDDAGLAAPRFDRRESKWKESLVQLTARLESIVAANLAEGTSEAGEERAAQLIDEMLRMFRGWLTSRNEEVAGGRPATPDLRTKSLGADTGYLWLFAGHRALHFLLQTGEASVHRTVDITREKLGPAIEAYAGALRSPGHEYRDSGRELSQWLLDPITESLKTLSIGRLLVWWDEPLRSIPVGALIDREGRFLAESVPSTLLLEPLSHGGFLPATIPADLTVVGFGSSGAAEIGGRSLPALPAVLEELDAIVRTAPEKPGLRPGRVWIDGSFTEAALVEEWSGDAGVLHFATHFVLEPDGTKSYLVLGAGQALTLAELEEKLTSTSAKELIVFSACDTSVFGSDPDGVPIDSLARWATSQGARDVVASHWKVADSLAAEFMSEFHAELAAGFSIAESINAAQLAFIHPETTKAMLGASRGVRLVEAYGHAETRHPHYWAAFSHFR